MFSWALVLPLAVPPYLAAYALAEFFLYTGPVQSLVRAVFGFQSIRDYWFPDIRSTARRGLRAVVGALPLRLSDHAHRLSHAGPQHRRRRAHARRIAAKVFWRVLLPVARPAIVAGVALVLMETINDIGASEYLGVRTLTFSVYTTWLNRGSLEGGAQIALLMLVLVLLLLAPRAARGASSASTPRAAPT